MIKVATPLPETKSSESFLFPGSYSYWDRRYAGGGNSGEGSYGDLAAFKAEILNAFVAENAIRNIIEFGCGDGNQLLAANYPQYLGFDISPTAIERCRQLFATDGSKSFKLMQEYAGETAELTVSLDVIYHLVEDTVFSRYMNLLFNSSLRYVIIYASNYIIAEPAAPHVKHRVFTDWVSVHKSEWNLMRIVPNRFPIGIRRSGTSFSHFFVYYRTIAAPTTGSSGVA